jgi:hypothetical protein
MAMAKPEETVKISISVLSNLGLIDKEGVEITFTNKLGSEVKGKIIFKNDGSIHISKNFTIGSLPPQPDGIITYPIQRVAPVMPTFTKLAPALAPSPRFAIPQPQAITPTNKFNVKKRTENGNTIWDVFENGKKMVQNRFTLLETPPSEKSLTELAKVAPESEMKFYYDNTTSPTQYYMKHSTDWYSISN